MNISKAKYLNATGIIFSVVFQLLYTGEALSDDGRQTHVVEIRNLKFVPADIVVKVGDTIKWVNRDIVPHTATADDKSWDSTLLESGKAWEVIVDKSMFTSYFCFYHPGMKAKIRIND